MLGLIKWGLWQRRWFIVWWLLAIAAFISLNLAFYPTFKTQQAELNQSLEQLPESAKALFSDTGDFASPTGFLSSQIYYLMLPMLLGIMAISLGSSVIGKEEKEGTLELLLARPVSRDKLLIGKAATSVILVGVGALVSLAVTLILARIVDLSVPEKNIVIATLACFLLATSFGAFAFLFASIGKVRSASIGIATLIALGGYIIASLSDLAKWLVWPSKALPFYYYRPGDILLGNVQWQYMLILTFIAIGCLVVSLISFRKRDIA